MPAVNALAYEPGWRIMFLALSASGYNDIALMRGPVARRRRLQDRRGGMNRPGKILGDASDIPTLRPDSIAAVRIFASLRDFCWAYGHTPAPAIISS